MDTGERNVVHQSEIFDRGKKLRDQRTILGDADIRGRATGDTDPHGPYANVLSDSYRDIHAYAHGSDTNILSDSYRDIHADAHDSYANVQRNAHLYAYRHRDADTHGTPG